MTQTTPDYLARARELRARRRGLVEPSVPGLASPLGESNTQESAHVQPANEPSAHCALNATRYDALITTADNLAELTARLQDERRVALDLETTGLDPHRDRVRLLTLATDRDVWLVDCFEVDPRPLFPVLAEKELVVHNALFDLGFLFELGFELGENGAVLDTMLLSQMLEGLRPKDEEEV